MKHLSIDLETMGTEPGCPILSIGAVYFDPETGEMGDHFYKAISLESSMELGMKPSASTIMWWMQQSEEARNEFVHKICYPAEKVLREFREFASGSTPWGNGATFDIGLLEAAFSMIGLPPTWKFWAIRDLRTLVELTRGEDLRALPFGGEKHNALYDAIHQAKMVITGVGLMK